MKENSILLFCVKPCHARVPPENFHGPCFVPLVLGEARYFLYALDSKARLNLFLGDALDDAKAT